jgi:hypothetical protein
MTKLFFFQQETRLVGEKQQQPPDSLNLAAAAGLPFFPGLGAGGFFQRGAPPTDFQVGALTYRHWLNQGIPKG